MYPNTLDARRFGAMFSDEQNCTMFSRLGDRRYTDIGAQNRRWPSFETCSIGVMDPLGRFDMPFVRHAGEAFYVRAYR